MYRERESNLGFSTELENLACDDKGKGTSGGPVRLKVLMRKSGADCFVVVMKRGNARGAKGAGHPCRDDYGSTSHGKNSRVLVEGGSLYWMARAV